MCDDARRRGPPEPALLISILATVVGLGLLAVAADQFVIGAARVARLRQVPPIVVGMVIVGFGTSAPELLVSTLAAIGDEPAIAVGNVVGSNIANLTLLLGVGAIILPLAVVSETVRREAPMTVAAVVLYGVVVQNGLTRVEGAVLVVAMAAALGLVVSNARRPAASGEPEADAVAAETDDLVDPDPDSRSIGGESIRTIIGLIGTIGGAQLLLAGATDLADRAGLSGGFVGATLVAVGTSLPELITVIQSARRQATDLIVGNLLGSNLFNALAVGGVSGLVGPAALDAPELTTVAVAASIGAAVVAAVFMATQRRVERWEGGVLVAAYALVVVLIS